MVSVSIPAIVVSVTLAVLTCLTMAQEWHDVKLPAPLSAPPRSPDYSPLSVSVNIGKSESSLSTRQKKIVASNNCVPNGGVSGGSQGQNGGYGVYGGPGLPSGWTGGDGGSTGSGGSTGLGGWGPMTSGGMKSSATGSASSVAGFVVFSAILLVTGLMYL